ncbi:unnamed protein product [Adineta ricciae]|uniref:glycogenin glucosyltransferase n=1 Tax=Adineta ricciae TaxID=249248 RepID=A0A815LSV6_ADIRI|nr:unnamed protein product [Adineta ricciae]
MYNRHSMSSEDFDNLPFRNRQQRYVSSKRNPTRFDRNERLREIFQNIFSLYDDHDEYHRYKQRSSLKSFADNSQKNVCQACQVVVTYRKDSKSRSTKTDEIVIKQKIDEYDRSIIIYKGYLQKNETFSFKSRHVREYPFDIKLYVNGYLEIHFKDCCEYKFCQGDIRLGHSFTIERIDKTIPCHKQIQREEKKKKNQMEVKKMWLNEEKHEIVDERINSQSEDETSNHNQNSTTLDEQETQQQKSKENSPDEPSQTEIDNNGNNSGFLQALLSFLRNGVAQVEIQETIAARYEGNVEDFVVIVFGFDIEMTQLYSIANFCKVFNEIKEMNSFIETLQVERILLVTNKDLSNESSKFSSIYRETSFNEDLLKKIRRENPIDNELISIEFSSSNQSFIYSQLLKETLLRKDEDANLKKDYFDYCRLHYKDNFNEMKLIDQLEKEFSEENLHFWFKKDSFCRKMLNRACRTNEIDILYKIRWILQGLNRQSPLSKPVYQLKYLTSNQLEQFQTSSKDFLSFANFLLCQFTKPSTLEFRSNYETVLFTIRSQNGIDFGESSNEVLLPFDNVYQIESIEQISSDENIYWNIHLISIDKEENNEFQKLIKEMKTQIESPATLIQFGKLLLANGDYLHADYFARFLFNDNSLKDNPTLLAGLAAIHHLLGIVLISNHLSDLIKQTLETSFDELVIVEELNSNDVEHLTLLSRPELGITFTKINCWLLEQYEKCVFLDSDCVVRRPIDDLFQREELSAAPDAGWPDCFNSGVFVFKPSKETFRQLMNFASQQNSSFDGGDQGLLNDFFSNWRTGDISRHLPFTYNVTANAFYSYLPAVTRFRNDIHVVHFAGATKPWQLTYNPQNEQLSGNLTGQSDIQRDFLLFWWRIMHQHVWPILTRFSRLSNSNNSLNSNEQNFLGQYSNTFQYENLTNNSGVELGSAEHRRAWEAGHIDYFGRDSFSNIQQQLERNIAQLPQQYHPSQLRQIPTNSTKTSSIPLQQITNIPKTPLVQHVPIKEPTKTINVKQQIIEEPPKTTISIQKPLKESVLSSPLLSDPVPSSHVPPTNWTVKSNIVTSFTQGVGDMTGPTILSQVVTETTASSSNDIPIKTSITEKKDLKILPENALTDNGTSVRGLTQSSTTNGHRIKK